MPRNTSFHTEGELLEQAIKRTQARMCKLLTLRSEDKILEAKKAMDMERSVLDKLTKVKNAALKNPR